MKTNLREIEVEYASPASQIHGDPLRWIGMHGWATLSSCTVRTSRGKAAGFCPDHTQASYGARASLLMLLAIQFASAWEGGMGVFCCARVRLESHPLQGEWGREDCAGRIGQGGKGIDDSGWCLQDIKYYWWKKVIKMLLSHLTDQRQMRSFLITLRSWDKKCL